MADMQSTIEKAKSVLAAEKDPESGRGLEEMHQLGQIKMENGRLSVTIGLTTHSAPLWEDMRSRLVRRLAAELPDVNQIEVELVRHDRPPQRLGQIGLTAKSVIAVGSGKGGVGKSTIAAILALGLKKAGCQVGLMDADVYGPSIPHLLGVTGQPEVEEKRIKPVEQDGLKVMSIGFMVPADKAVIWRGPMLHGAITNFLRDTEWGHLDYLIIDMPPGTGDVALTLSQLLPLTGAVVVCTPQDVALLDAVKAINMFRQLKIPLLGVVENMSYFQCPGCGQRHEIFGRGGARRRAEEMQIPFLGEVPINIQIRVHGDEGKTWENFQDGETAEPLNGICYRLVKSLATQHEAEPPLPSLSVL
ncbi:MAG: P-loop NTPase [Planctomycetales bacterium]|nr:P-loop NTPase [Planctomycetales bacterium]NIM08950.1 P-loop NTPase [Planctomycetales bacterium]NIN08414.1 P-loop NTPase [Planctomycetales bacterium]NIN77543.1 P-loop NTPase [Planctomycetales bacterium]NIO34713.1 P-loop NTPase [Planctomycetales bacterium]